MERQPVKIEYEATVEDYRRVLLWYQWKRLLVIVIAYVVVVCLIVFAMSYGAGGPTNPMEGLAPVTVIMLLLLLPLLIGVSGFFAIWRQASKTAKVTEPAIATVYDTGIKIETKSSTTERNWETFFKVHETQWDFIFFPFENVFYSIPKRFFRNESELASMKDILRAGLGKRAKLYN